MALFCRFAARGRPARTHRSLSRVSKHCSPAGARRLSWWSHVEMGPKDPILGVTEAFLADTDARKLNLGVGAYRDDAGKPQVLKSVREAERKIVEAGLNMEYAPISGSPELVKHATELAFGASSQALQEGRVAALQSLSGTGALRLATAFLKRFGRGADLYLPTPTWGNHIPITEDAGINVQSYRYYNPQTKGLDLQGMLEDLRNAPSGSYVLLHACAHNPTGVDPTPQEWAEISHVVKSQGHFPVIDMAYQGFASGDPARDGFAVNKFVEDGHQFALCQSFAKNFGLYGHRVGCFSMVTTSPAEKANVESQLKILARPIYSSPPIHGARIVSTIMGDPALSQQWYADVKEMAERIIKMRVMLYDHLLQLGSSHNWQHVLDQIGMFCFSGLTPEQVDRLTNEYHIYLTRNGRISMAGVTSANVGYLAEAMHEVTK